MYHKELERGLVIKNPSLDDVAALEHVQRTCFPTLAEDEIISAAHYASHLRIFPAGQIAIYDGDALIAATTTMRYSPVETSHTFLEVSGNLYLTTHEPDGEWLYGIDMGVLPTYRGRGLARQLYRARQDLVRQLGLKGQAIAGMIPGYGAHKDQYSLEEYYQKVVQGEIWDATTSTQMRMGFKPIRLLYDYLEDPSSGNASVMMLLPADAVV